MALKIKPVGEQHKHIIRNLMQAYLHDLSEYNGDNPTPDGLFKPGRYFEQYWLEDTRYAFKFEVDGRLAGFALVNQHRPDEYTMAEFFVLRRFRKKGVGREAAFMLFDKMKGVWHVAQDEFNLLSQQFWRKVVSEYTDGNFDEGWSERQPRGPKQSFVSAA